MPEYLSEYMMLGSIPTVYTQFMEKEEKDAWTRLSTKFYIKKNVLNSTFYKEHKEGIIKRINFLYEYAVENNLRPSLLSFKWADEEKDNIRMYADESDTTSTVNPPTVEDSIGNGNSDKQLIANNSTTCHVFNRGYFYDNYYMDVCANYKAYRQNDKITFEPNGNSFIIISPSTASFSGTAFMSIMEEGFAVCYVDGSYHAGYFVQRLEHIETHDLLSVVNN